MSMERLAFDFDGVVTLGIRPGPSDVIITGRVEEERAETESALRAMGLENDVHFAPGMAAERTDASSAAHKERVLRALGITRFFENDATQAPLIAADLPDVQVVRVLGPLK